MDNTPANIKASNLLLAWVVTSLGFPFGGILALYLVGPMDDVVSAALGGLLTGAVVGAAQWPVLRHYLGIDATWIVATASGLTLGNAVGAVLTDAGTSINDLLVIGVVSGISVAAAQWTLLRERLRYAGLWIPVLAVAWPLGWATTWSIGVDISLGYTVFDAVGALVFTAITGVVLLLMVRSLSYTPDTESQEKDYA